MVSHPKSKNALYLYTCVQVPTSFNSINRPGADIPGQIAVKTSMSSPSSDVENGIAHKVHL
jgi:hypothetical protein